MTEVVLTAFNLMPRYYDRIFQNDTSKTASGGAAYSTNPFNRPNEGLTAHH